MKRPTIKTALTCALALIAATVIAFSIVSVTSMGALDKRTQDITSRWLPKVALSKDMNIELSNASLGYHNYIMALTLDSLKSSEQSISAANSAFLEAVVQYEVLISDDYGRDRISKVKELFDNLNKLGDMAISLARARKLPQATELQQTRMQPLENDIRKLLGEIVVVDTDGAAASQRASAETYRSTLAITYLIISLCLAVIVAAIYFAIAGVAKPIQTITVSMKRLAEGNTDSPVPYAGRSDELGEMAAAVEIFRANAVENLRLQQEADTNRNQSELERRRNAEAERIKGEAMAQATGALEEGLKHLASGDLTFQLENPFAIEFETLRADFNGAVAQLAGTLRAVAEAADAIDTGSREISASSDDLSKRTEQQAASLEETASALDEITVNVANSSKRAEEARQVAMEATESASQSGRVVANAVDAMQKIEQSSDQISNIIGVIDEIAFQTNLLALNAGVEAARAGDSGKGFAVVAQEVRELAQRSAQAAKEIKELIRNASREVQNGVQLVRETGDALRTIEDHIVAMNQHMASIATSSKGQSVGLDEVNTAVNQMDYVTQQNAAMVEETSAAGARLASESGRLRELISKFKLDLDLRVTGSVMPANHGSRVVIPLSGGRQIA
ncbi:HAMP domain-containing methyl-accepting chemotaxis protein [Agrobacterium tumefaciens]|uniref:HAMP domain-containing methyl-accepting chemotaxis protein n=1 Tax=Agrobacterium tumefaciens TaxID=358 RepID=UPI001EEEAD41|nr:methyl-accepting chemotaxis protein [Agrobacterium tumefaciens]WCK69523.1 methyl-accepting chemotaxis protein [Agrobacterium tumefaciens]